MISATDRQRTRFGEIPQYLEGLYDLGNRVYAWLLPNGAWYESNAGLVVGEGESLLVDTLCDLNLTGEMLQAMNPVIRDAPIKLIVNTHSDGDHIWGNELLDSAEIIMTKACEKEALELKPAAMAMLGKAGKTFKAFRTIKMKKIGGYFFNMVAAYDFKPVKVKTATRAFENELSLEVGGREIRLIEVGPAHTRGDLIVYLPDTKILFAGDILFSGCTPVMWAGPVENYISALDRILAMDVDMVVPGHGPVSDKKAISSAKEYLEYLKREASERFEEGMPAKEAAYDIALSDDFSRRVWSRWDSAERIMTNTFVIYRHLQGKTGHLKAAEKLNILRKQALLAYELPQVTPASMHKL
jgi:cyclase